MKSYNLGDRVWVNNLENKYWFTGIVLNIGSGLEFMGSLGIPHEKLACEDWPIYLVKDIETGECRSLESETFFIPSQSQREITQFALQQVVGGQNANEVKASLPKTIIIASKAYTINLFAYETMLKLLKYFPTETSPP